MQENDDFVEDASPPIVVDGEYDERESLMQGYASKDEVIELKKQEKQHSKRIKQLKKQLEKQHLEAKSEVNILKNQVQLLLAKFATKETIDDEEKEELLGDDDEELGNEDQFNDNDEGGESSALITTYSTTINDTPPQNNFDINDYDDEKDAKSIASITSRRPSIRRSLIPIYDDKTDTELSFQESSYLMLMTENTCTLVFGITFSILGIAVGSLVLALVSAFDGEEGNLLNIPPDVTPQVRASQVLGAVIGILTEQDSVQGILLLRYACKSSLQIDAGDGKGKLIPPWKVLLSSLSFFSVGYLFLINLVFVIVKADDVLSLFFDIVALEFVLNVDDLFFTLCKTGIFGKRLHAGSDNIDNLEVQNIPAKRSLPNRFKGCTTKILYLANFLAVFLSMTYFGIKQEQGSYSCKSVTITYIGDEIWESAIAVVNDKPSQRVLLYSYFNGVYKQDGTTHDGMPRFVEQNKETDKAFESTIPSEFIYCNDLQRWIMFHPNIYKTDNDAENEVEKCENWLVRSAETKSFDLTEVASQGEWDIWVGTIQKGVSVSIICNECDSIVDCNFNGNCTAKQECVCDPTHFGQQCQYETPCDVLVTENIEKGDRTQLLLVKPDTKSSNFTTSYGRPIYTINGLSERPDALLSVSSKSQEVSQENYEDDDFFLKSTKNETKELLQYYRVTLTFSGSRWFAAINKPDFNAQDFYNSEYHAFWKATYSDRTFLISGATDTGTPVGVPFFSPRRRSEENYGNKDYGAFGILLPNTDIEGVGFFQCYAYSEDCVVLDISVTTQNKTLPSNIEKYSSKDQIVSWELFKGDQLEQESASVLLERAQIVHSYCLPTNVAYTFQMKDEICKSSWWDCKGPGFSGYNISVNGDMPIMEAYNAFPESKFSFSLLPSGTSDKSDSYSDFCSNKPNFNVTIHTDGSPYEISWELSDNEGSTLLTGGPYSYYKSFSTFNHLACLQDADGYNFTIFDSGGDGLNSPGYYDLMVGEEYIAKGAHTFDSSSSILFNLMNGTMFSESSSSLDISTEVQDNQHSLSNCSTVFTYISGLNVTRDDRVSTSLFDVNKQAYVYQEQHNDPHDPKSPCLYDGVYTYTFQNPTYDCVDGDLKLLKDETNDLVLHSGSICSNDTFTFMAKDMLGKVETTLQGACMNNFHLVVPSNITSAILWELSGSNGVILRGDKLGPLSPRLNSHRACLTPGTYKFTTWADAVAKYSLSYGKTAVTPDLDQITPIGTAMESVDISDLTFSSTTVGDIVGNYTSNIEDDDVWIIEGSGLGIGATSEPLGNSDSFQYVNAKFSGDFALTVKVNTGSTSGGIMFRDTLDPDSKQYSLFMGKDGLQNLYRRTCAGCETLSGLSNPDISSEPMCEDSNPQVCGCASLNQTDYQGTISTTINNTECLQWDVIDNPIFYRNYPNASLGENSNYCRNPDGWDRGAWCFTSLDGSKWEECDVPICEGSLPTAKRSIWLRVVKEKDMFSSFYKESDESGEWLRYGSPVNIRFSNPEFFVGVAVTSNNNETMEASNITISAEREQREFMFTLYDEQKVLPTDGAKFEEFGKAIAVDGSTMVVSDQDSVYVFIKVDEKWEQQEFEASEGSKFTSTLALDGDTLAIAALPLDEDYRDDVASESIPAGESVLPSSPPSIEGAIDNCADKDIKDLFVQIYTRIDGMWNQTSNLTDTAHNGGIGSSIALEGSRIVVGAKGDKKDCSGGGSVYVYTRNDGEWEKSATLIPSDDNNRFGYAVALTGDTIVVGAYDSTAAPTPSPNTFPTYSPYGEIGAYMTPPPITRMLSLETEFPTYSSTLDGESILPPTGDNESESPIEGFGAAYVFTLDGDEWEEKSKLQPNHREQYDKFGSAVALSSDGTLVVGAFGGSVFGVGSGVAYVYSKEEGGNWTEQAKLLHSDAGPGDEFAYSVAVNDDTIVVGSPKYNEDRGSVFVFRRDNDNIWKEEDFLEQNNGGTPEFGFAVSFDGADHVYIGAPGANNENGAGSGAVYELFTPLSELDNKASSFQVQSTDSPSSSPPSSSLSPSSSNTTSIVPNMTTLESDLIDGYTFVGKGCCRNSGGTLFSPNTIYEVNDVGDCAKACREKYSSDGSFVGINFLSRSTWTLCNCLMDESNDPTISLTESGCTDELCYSYNDPTISLTESGCTDVEFGFSILSDQFPEETTWTLTKVNDTEVILRGFAEEKFKEYQYQNTMCLEQAQYEFTIYDSYGDGLYDANVDKGGQYNVTVGGTVIMEGGELKEKNISETFSIPLRFTEMPSSSPSTSMLPTLQPSMSLVPSASSSPTLSLNPTNVPSVSMAPSSCFDLGINVTSNTIWALSLVSNVNGTRDELIIDNSPVKLQANGLLYSAAIFEYSVPDENATGLLCNCGLGMSQCDDCQDKICLIERVSYDVYSEQVSNCENGGGIASVIYSNVPEPITPQNLYGTTPEISVVYISQENGHYLLNNEIGTTVEVSVFEDAPYAEESLCLTRGEYHFTYYREYCYDDCYYNITIGGEMVIQGEIQSEEEINIPFSIPFVASTSPSVSPSWAVFPSISPSITTQPTQVPSSLPSISPTSSLSPTNTPSVMPSIDCSDDDVRAKFYIGYYSYDTSWTISRIIRSNAQVVFEGKPQNSGSVYEYNEEYELCLQDGEYKFTKIGYGGSFRIVINETAIAQSSGDYSPQEIVSFTIPYIGTAVPTKAPITDSPTLAPTTTAAPTTTSSPTKSSSPTVDAPLVDGYTFIGEGSCQNAEGNTYSYQCEGCENNVGACINACNEAYSLDESFVGVNFYLIDEYCDCLMDDNGENGQITGTQSVGFDILCYSYNDYSPSETAVGNSILSTNPPTTAPSEDTVEPTSSPLNQLSSSSPSSPSSISPAVVAVELRTKRVRHHSLPNPVQEKKNALDE